MAILDLTVDSCIVYMTSIPLQDLLEHFFYWNLEFYWNSLHLLLKYFKFYTRIFKKTCRTWTSGLSDFFIKGF